MPLIALCEKIFFDNVRYWGKLNTSLYNHGSIWAVMTDVESADLNMAWNEKPLTPGDSQFISYVKNNFRKANLPFWWWVFPTAQSKTTGEILKAAGFSFVDSIPSMYADLTLMPEAETLDASVSILCVSSKAELAFWEDVSFAGFDFPAETKNSYHRFVSTFNLNPGAPQKFFLACRNGKPVATSLLFLNGTAGGIYFVTTLADHRRKGIGLQLMRATMCYARMAGINFVTLQSSPDGLRVYKQAGFEECGRVNVYSPAED